MDLELRSDDGKDVLLVTEVPVVFVRGDLCVAGILGQTALQSLVAVFREYEAKLNVRDALDFQAPQCPHCDGRHPGHLGTGSEVRPLKLVGNPLVPLRPLLRFRECCRQDIGQALVETLN